MFLHPSRTSPLATLVTAALVAAALAAPDVSPQSQPPVFIERKHTVLDFVYDIDLGDVNDDAILDLGTLSQNTYQTHLGIGDGSFLPGVTTSLPHPGIWSTTLAEVTGDGQADLLVVEVDFAIHLYKGVGDGSFEHFNSYFICSDGNESIAVDMNHDGIHDLVVVAGDFVPGCISVWLGAGGGLFGNPFHLSGDQFLMDGPYTVDAADIDGDGHLDLVVRDDAFNLSVVRGNGDGTLEPPHPTTIPYAAAASFADMNLDGAPDIVAGMPLELKVLLNLGNGQFAQPLVSPPLANLYHVPIGDLNCDGKPDAAGTIDGFLAISLGRGDGTFDPPLSVPLGHEMSLLRTGDLDGDGSLDLVGRVGILGLEGEVSALVNQLPAWPWRLIGTGLAGRLGVPQLHGTGSLQAGHPLSLTVSEALPDATAFLVIGDPLLAVPFKGGVLLPHPSIVWPLVTNAAGAAAFTASVPPGLPSHLTFYSQAWIPDSGPLGFAATNGVMAILP